MSLRGLLRRGGASSTHSLNALAEPQNLEDALRATNYILNDDLESAEEGLRDGTSSFHKLGRGLLSFMKASLGFEADAMKEAAERLADAENSASNDYRRAQKENSAFHSAIYGVGSEYALCSAQAQLLSAIVGVLNESLTESLKGFYKLRKAYITLDSIAQAEDRYMQLHRKPSPEPLRSTQSDIENLQQQATDLTIDSSDQLSSHPASAKETIGADSSQSSVGATTSKGGEDLDSDDDDAFEEARESLARAPTLREYTGHMEIEGMVKRADSLCLSLPSSPTRKIAESAPSLLDTTPAVPRLGRTLTYDPDSELFAESVDVFIHSGTSVFFGMIQLLLSMIPPVFGRLLSIIGFQGDRDRGLRLLWQATKFKNIHGALAGLVLLNYYNAFIGFNNIVPEDAGLSTDLSTGESIKAHPRRRLEALLADMRSLYPKSGLWLLEDARMQASKRHLDESLSLLTEALNKKQTKAELKQVRALMQFEKSLQSMYAHRYADCTEGFEECCRLNDWSHALYLYIAASAQVELYRQAKETGDKQAAQKYEDRVMDLLKRSRSQIGKRKVMARPLPFDAFVGRKMSKWETRAAAFNISVIDAIGVSPLVEITYFWNGFKKMGPDHIKATMHVLDQSETILKDPKWRDELDELTALAALKATTLRTAGKYPQAAELLKSEVLSNNQNVTKGAYKDNWQQAVGCYEMASVLWAQKGEENVSTGEQKRLVKEAQEWLEKASKSESYELEARMGMRITIGLNTLKGWLEDHGV